MDTELPLELSYIWANHQKAGELLPLHDHDGIYSFNMPIYGSDILDTNLQTKTGSFKWEFIVQDEAGEYSKIKEHNVFIK